MLAEDIDIVARAIAEMTAPLLERIAALEQTRSAEVILPMAPAIERGEVGPQGPVGPAGKDVDIEEVVARLLPLIPVPKDGTNGLNGTNGCDAPPVDLEAVAKAAAALIPQPKDGTDGKDGRDGKSADPVDIEAVAKAAAALVPVPRDGRDGMPGTPGRDGAKGADGSNGNAGADGLGFDDFEEEIEDDGRFIVHRYKAADGRVKEFRHKTAWLVYRDVYKPGQAYDRGDVVTWGNQSHVCREATTTKPGEGPAWRLHVRKGGDGKAGPQGPQGERGMKGDMGPMGPARY